MIAGNAEIAPEPRARRTPLPPREPAGERVGVRGDTPFALAQAEQPLALPSPKGRGDRMNGPPLVGIFSFVLPLRVAGSQTDFVPDPAPLADQGSTCGHLKPPQSALSLRPGRDDG